MAVQPKGLRISRNSPLRRSEENADVSVVEVHHTGRNGISFDGLIDSGKNDHILGGMNDDAATGEVGNNFVLAVLSGKGNRWHNGKKQ